MALLNTIFTQHFPVGAELAYDLQGNIMSFYKYYGNTFSNLSCLICAEKNKSTAEKLCIVVPNVFNRSFP